MYSQFGSVDNRGILVDSFWPTRYHSFVYNIGIQAFQFRIPNMYTKAVLRILYMYKNIYLHTQVYILQSIVKRNELLLSNKKGVILCSQCICIAYFFCEMKSNACLSRSYLPPEYFYRQGILKKTYVYNSLISCWNIQSI